MGEGQLLTLLILKAYLLCIGITKRVARICSNKYWNLYERSFILVVVKELILVKMKAKIRDLVVVVDKFLRRGKISC